MPPGLRERKKLKTKAAIQQAAIRLFLDQGFDETTIEQIAAAAEISPSTFFNYFPSKEDVVFEDELDPLILAAFDAQPAGTNPIRAIRTAMTSVMKNITPEQDALVRERLALMISTPSLRAAMLAQFADMVQQIAALVASRTGGSPDDFAVRNFAGALLGVMMSAFLTAAADPKMDLIEAADQALSHLEAGLPLDFKPPPR